jgi:hypothetical protein
MRHSRECMTGQHPECGHMAKIGVSFWEGGRMTLSPAYATATRRAS